MSPVPAAIAAVTSSGLSCRRFAFEAFLPKDKKKRRRILEELKAESRTIIIYEAPHHLKDTLKELHEALGDRRVSLARELTKVHEEHLLMKLSEALEYYEKNDPRGEFVLVIEGKSSKELEAEARALWEDLSIEAHMEKYLSQGMDKKEAMKAVAKDRGVSKRDIYQQLIK